MTTWFISDLHLHPARPQSMALACEFLAFVQQQGADAVYILGDLYEYWIGDDMGEHVSGAGYQPFTQALQTLTSKIPVYFQHGNRDFLIGQHWLELTGVQLLPEEKVIDLYSNKTLLMHGDSLCTDDQAYQQLRTQLRNPVWQRQFLALPLETRLQQAQALRSQSQAAMQTKAEEILDVTPSTVDAVMLKHQVTQLIHGHTHRPQVHTLSLKGQAAQRIVLGDWYGQQGSFLKVTPTTLTLLNQLGTSI